VNEEGKSSGNNKKSMETKLRKPAMNFFDLNNSPSKY